MIEVEADETILEIAVEENIPYPFGCRSGNCGACKSRLVLGEAHMREHSSMALTADEAARGLVLACRAEPRSDCTLAVVNYDDALAHPLKQLVGEVSAVEKLTHDIAAVQIALPEPMDYTAGQFAAVAFPGFPARDYSFASPPMIRPGLNSTSAAWAMMASPPSYLTNLQQANRSPYMAQWATRF